MVTIKDWLENSRIDEMTKKTSADVKWKSGFSKGIGKFSVQDEDYEIEFDEFIENNQNVAGIKFFRMKNNIRVIKYVESKDPLTVSLTKKEKVKKPKLTKEERAKNKAIKEANDEMGLRAARNMFKGLI